jgi:hypothetical protein
MKIITILFLLFFFKNLNGQELSNYEKKIEEIHCDYYRTLKINETLIQLAKKTKDWSLIWNSKEYNFIINSLNKNVYFALVLAYNEKLKDARKLMSNKEIEKEKLQKNIDKYKESDKYQIIKDIERKTEVILAKSEFEKEIDYKNRLSNIKNTLDSIIIKCIENQMLSNQHYAPIKLKLLKYNAETEKYSLSINKYGQAQKILLYFNINPEIAKQAHDEITDNNQSKFYPSNNILNWAFIDNILYPIESKIYIGDIEIDQQDDNDTEVVSGHYFKIQIPEEQINGNIEFYDKRVSGYLFDWNKIRLERINREKTILEEQKNKLDVENKKQRMIDSIELDRKLEQNKKLEEEKQIKITEENNRILEILKYDSIVKIADSFYEIKDYNNSINFYNQSINVLNRDYPQSQILKAKFEIKVIEDTLIINSLHNKLLQLKYSKKIDMLYEVERYIYNDFIKNYSSIRYKIINNLENSPFKCDDKNYLENCTHLKENENPLSILIRLQEKLLKISDLENKDLILKIKSITNYKEKALLIINEN